MPFLPLLLTSLGLRAASLPAPRADDFHWRGVVARGKVLEIRGINGDVSASAASGNEAEVVGVKTSRDGKPAKVEVRVVQSADGVTICTVYRPEQTEGCDESRDRHRNHDEHDDVTVTFTVKVPAGVRFVGRTVNGGIAARDLDADVQVATVNGSAEASSRGFVEATTVNGSVRVKMGRTDWKGSLDLTTVNGDVTVELPGSPSMDVRGSTLNGSFETDFPLTVSGRFGPRRLNGTLGSGGRRLTLTTVNGSIHLVHSR